MFRKGLVETTTSGSMPLMSEHRGVSLRRAKPTADPRCSIDRRLLFTSLSKEFTFPSFSSASSLDDIVPVDDVLGIFVMSPSEYGCINDNVIIAFDGSKQ